MNALVLALSGILVCAVSAIDDEPFYFCKENTCNDCPVQVASGGTGYPACVIYNSDDVFANQGYPGSEGGGYQPYLDVAEPDTGCKTIVRSPANTQDVDCGKVVGAFSHASCATIPIDETFMVQFCCGTDQCQQAGAGRIRRSAKFGDVTVFEEINMKDAADGGLFGLKLFGPNGTAIEPAAIGLPGQAAKRAAEGGKTDGPVAKNSAFNPLQRRDACQSGSWVADAGREDYTKPADTQVVHDVVSGPADVDITQSREQSWTTTLEASLGFADVISLGMSFSESYEESITDTSGYTFTVLAGQTGMIGFTPYLECSTGHGVCNGADVSGEVCVPYKTAGGLAGEYSLIVTG